MVEKSSGATLGCEEARALLPLLPVDALEPDERAELEAHLAGCAGCALEARKVADAVHEVARLGPARKAPSPEAWTKLVRELDVPAPDELAAARAVSGIRVALDCAYCKGSIARREAAFCASCLAPHHEECFRAHRRCSTYGCDETRLVRPKEAAGSETPVAAPVPAQPSRFRRVASPLVIAALGGLVSAAAVVGAKGRLSDSNLVADVGERRAAELLVHANEEMVSRGVTAALSDLSNARAALPAGPSALRKRLEDRTLEILAAEVKKASDGADVSNAEYWLRKAEELEFAPARPGELDALRALAMATGVNAARARAERGEREARERVRRLVYPAHEAPTLSGKVVPGKVALSWAPSPENQYVKITQYRLERRDVGATEWLALPDGTTTGDKTRYEVTGSADRPGEYRVVEVAVTDSDDPVIAHDKTSLDPKDAEKASSAWLVPLHPDAGWIAEAETQLAAGKLDAALEAFDNAVALAPRDPGHRLARARARLGSHSDKDTAAALDDVALAIELAPRSPEGWLLRAEIELDRQKDMDGALKHVGEAILAAKDDPRPLRLRARIHEARGDVPAALADIDRAVALAPADVDLLSERAELRATANDVKGQIADLTKLIELAPKRRWLYLGRGEALRSTGDLDGALADFSRFIELDPTSAKAWQLRAVVRLAKRDFDGALADATKAIELEPDAATLLLRADASLEKGDLDGAALDASAVLANPKAAELGDRARRIRGFARAKKGYTSGAREDLEAVAASLEASDASLGPVLDALDSLSPVTTASLVERAKERTLHGDSDRAIDAADRALRLDASQPTALFWRARARFDKGDFAGSAQDALEATKLDPASSEGWCLLGLARTKTHELSGAIEAYEKATVVSPEVAHVWHELSGVHALRRDWAKARSALERALPLDPSDEGIVGDYVHALVQMDEPEEALHGLRSVKKPALPAAALLELAKAAVAKHGRVGDSVSKKDLSSSHYTLGYTAETVLEALRLSRDASPEQREEARSLLRELNLQVKADEKLGPKGDEK